MNENLTFIAVVLDRSGSMFTVQADTIGGFNAFLAEQQACPGEATLMLVQFADDRQITSARPIADVAPLTPFTYYPDGPSTALYDAIGFTIDAVGARLAALPEADRPGKVLIMIQTDGLENSSRLYSRERVAEMIKHQRAKYNWNFVFVGASEAAVSDAVDLGIAQNWTMQYAPTPEGTAEILASASAGTRMYRSAQTVNGVMPQNFDFFSPAPE